MALAPARGCNLLRVEEGRLVMLPELEPGQSFYHRAEKLAATCRVADDWVIRLENGLDFLLGPDPAGAGQLGG